MNRTELGSDWKVTVAKDVSPNTTIGFQADIGGNFRVAAEHVRSDHTEVKLQVTSSDQLNIEVTKVC